MMWKKLSDFACIDVIAPAKAGDNNFDAIRKIFDNLGYALKIPSKLLKPVLFCANTDAYRAKHLIESLSSKQTQAIWAWRGGYGCARIIDKLNDIKSINLQKLFIGYSDITALHLYLSQKWGWKTIHAPVLTDILALNKDVNNFALLWQLISNHHYTIRLPIAAQLNDVKFNHISGKLTGGNLTVIQSGIGSGWQMQADERIVFLEDVEEEGYRVDRILEQFWQVNLLSKAKAVIFGEFIYSGKQNDIDIALKRFADKAEFPVFKTNYFGHGYHNYPLMYNAVAQVKQANEAFELTYSNN